MPAASAVASQDRLHIGVDVGGTFTDVVAVDETGRRVEVIKTPSTRNQALGILDGVSKIAGDRLDRVSDISHGTTVATNILLEGKGARVALLTTRGFKDTIEIGRCRRLIPGTIFNLRFVRPKPLIPRSLRFEIDERIAFDGRVLRPYRAQDLEPLCAELIAADIQAVVICFLNSHVNPAHELLARETVQAKLPSVYVCCSSEIIRQIREYERFSTAVVNGYIAPQVSRYMSALMSELQARGYRHGVLTMASSGGLLPAETVSQQPVRTVLSGPAAAVNGAIYVGTLAKRSKLITYDMGGTSTDVCLVEDGEPLLTNEAVIAGMPLGVPQLDIHTVGTGGGSIAWIDVDGRPRVGPQSAGADPGPISYGKGGADITITDANLFLGRLPSVLLDGALELDVEPLASAFGAFAAKLRGGRREQIAEGLIRVAVATMAASVRKISIERGYDPREFSLFAIGGAGPMHAALVADELQIREVLVPPFPGNISALGHLVGELRQDAVQSFRADVRQFRSSGGAQILKTLAAAAHRRLESHAAIGGVVLRYYGDLRYVGQSFEISVPLELPLNEHATQIEFARRYRQRYGHDHDEPVEFTNLRVVCVAKKKRALRVGHRANSTRTASTRPVFFDGRWVRAPVTRREHFGARRALGGPAIVEEYGTTTVIPPGWTAHVGPGGCLILRRR